MNPEAIFSSAIRIVAKNQRSNEHHEFDGAAANCKCNMGKETRRQCPHHFFYIHGGDLCVDRGFEFGPGEYE
jgi:hypothetical protein